MKLSGYIPILEWLPKYQRKYLGSDLLAGLTVGVMVIPQGMAYGMLAGLPPIYGLYASLVPMAIYALLGTSKHLVIGPAAMVSLMVAFGVGQLDEPSTAEFIRLATTLALMVGIIQFSLGMLRMGFLTNFLSYPILSGFTSAASIIIFFSQLKHLVGIDLARTQHVHKIIFEAMKRFGELQPQTLIVGLAGIGIIVLASRIHKAIPSALLAVIFGICAAYFMPLEAQGVLLVGNVPEGLPVFAMPNLEFSNLKSLFPIALTISLIGILESMVIAKAIHRRHKDYDIIPNQEFRALGIANLLGSMFQAYPSDASFSRSAINDEAGAKTGVSSLVGAAIVALTLIFITGWFYYLPKAILASVIMVAIVKLINVKDARFLWHSNRTDFYMLLATFLATLFIGIQQGIVIGIVLSLIMVIYESTRPNFTVLGRIPGTIYYRNAKRFVNIIERKDILVMRFDSHLFFANAAHFRDRMEKEIRRKGDDLKLIIINADAISNLDSTGLNMLKDLIKDLHTQELKVYFSGVTGPVRDAMYKAELKQWMGSECFYLAVQEAVDAFDKGESSDFNEYTMQANT